MSLNLSSFVIAFIVLLFSYIQDVDGLLSLKQQYSTYHKRQKKVEYVSSYNSGWCGASPFSHVKSMSRNDDLFQGDAEQTQQIQLPTASNNILSIEVVEICMSAMQTNTDPFIDAGLEVCFNFSSDSCRAALGGSLSEFITYAHNPTFGSMLNMDHWEILRVGDEIAASQTRGAMQTFLTRVVPGRGIFSGGDPKNNPPPPSRHFLWTLQKERRPPRQGCWLVHECILVENAFALTL